MISLIRKGISLLHMVSFKIVVTISSMSDGYVYLHYSLIHTCTFTHKLTVRSQLHIDLSLPYISTLIYILIQFI